MQQTATTSTTRQKATTATKPFLERVREIPTTKQIVKTDELIFQPCKAPLDATRFSTDPKHDPWHDRFRVARMTRKEEEAEVCRQIRARVSRQQFQALSAVLEDIRPAAVYLNGGKYVVLEFADGCVAVSKPSA